MIDDKLIFGAHTIIYSQNAEADRTFLRDVLDYPASMPGTGGSFLRLPPLK